MINKTNQINDAVKEIADAMGRSLAVVRGMFNKDENEALVKCEARDGGDSVAFYLIFDGAWVVGGELETAEFDRMFQTSGF